MNYESYNKLKNMQVMRGRCDICNHYNAVLCPTGLYIEYYEEKPFSWTMTIGEVTVSGSSIEELYELITHIKRDLDKLKTKEDKKDNILICYVFRLVEVQTFFEGHITAGDPNHRFEVVIDDTICLRDSASIAPINSLDELRTDFLKTDETDNSKLLAMFGQVAFDTFLVDSDQTHKIFKTAASKAKYQINKKLPVHHKSWLEMLIPDQDDYHFIRYKCFRASICMNHGTDSWYDMVSYDQVSAHAHKLITKDFPITKPRKLKTIPENVTTLLQEKWCWFEAELEGVASFEETEGLDPFKVRGQQTFTFCGDQLQWQAFCKFYYFEKVTYKQFLVAEKGKLPKELRCAIADLYMDKANHPTKDAVRNMLKVILNSGSYGVFVEKLYDYWTDEKETIPRKYNNSQWRKAWEKRIAPPQVGVSITSYVFLDELSIIAEDPKAFGYCDTDSVKAERSSKAIIAAIEARNKQSFAEVKEFCDQFGYDYSLMKTLGSYELDAEYIKLKAIAPKEYIYLTKDGKYGATTAGYASHYEAKPEWSCQKTRVPVALYEAFNKNADPFKYFTVYRHFVDYKNLWCSKDRVMVKGWFKLTIEENSKVVAKLEKLYKK